MSGLTLMPFDPSRPLGPGAPAFPWETKKYESIMTVHEIKILYNTFHNLLYMWKWVIWMANYNP